MNAGSVPAAVGMYRILDEVGRGGMGVVYRAEREDGAVVALKVIAPELALNPTFRERFTRESELMIEHPHILPVYEAGVADGRLYMAMKLVNGTDLKRMIRSEGRLLPARVVNLFKQAADALDAAHAHGFVHRDVKPQNFLVERNVAGDTATSEIVYLSDFGLVKRIAAQTSLTGSAHLVGTMQYMSPEQIRGREVDGRTDVYALGCVLYECLTGSPPYAADEEVAVLWSHVNEDPPRVSDSVPVLPDALDAVVAKAIAKDPNDRYLTAGDLADDLEAVLRPGSTAGKSRVWSSGEGARPRTLPPPPQSHESPARDARGRGVTGWVAAAVVTVAATALLLTRDGEIVLPSVVEDSARGSEQYDDPEAVTGLIAREKTGASEVSRKPEQGASSETALSDRLQESLSEAVPAARARDAGDPDSTASSATASSAGSTAVARHPASGSYLYAQDGNDRICPDGRACVSGRDLPDTQELRVAQAGLSRPPTVLSSAGISPRFALASTVRYGYSRAKLGALRMSFDTEFGTFDVDLEPQPALDWLVFPLSPGARWSGRWESRTPGGYVVKVVNSRRLSVAGRKVDAVQIRTSLEWGGGHPGVMETISWIARDTRVVLQSTGHVRVATKVRGYEYDASFTARLRRGPGYPG